MFKWVSIHVSMHVSISFVIGKLSSYCVPTIQTTSEGKKKIIVNKISKFTMQVNIVLYCHYHDIDFNMWSKT